MPRRSRVGCRCLTAESAKNAENKISLRAPRALRLSPFRGRRRCSASAGLSWRSRWATCCFGQRLVSKRLPEVPGRDRPIGLPDFSDLQDPFRVRPFPQLVEPLNRVDDAEVAGGEDVPPGEPEHQEHLGGPAAEALHRGEALDYLFILPHLQIVPVQPAGCNAGAEVAPLADLLSPH